MTEAEWWLLLFGWEPLRSRELVVPVGDWTEKGCRGTVFGENMEESSEGETMAAEEGLFPAPRASSRWEVVAAANVLAA